MISLRASVAPWIVLAVVIFGSIFVNVASASTNASSNYVPKDTIKFICPMLDGNVEREVLFKIKDKRAVVQVTQIFSSGKRSVLPTMMYQHSLMGIDAFSTDVDSNRLSPNALTLHVRFNPEYGTAAITMAPRVNGEITQEEWRVCFVPE